MRLAALLLGPLVLAAVVAGVVWWVTLGAALTTMQEKGRSDLSLAADRLRLELQRARDLAVYLAADPEVAAATAGRTRYPPSRLQGFADRSRAADVLLVRRDGALIASASQRSDVVIESPWLVRARQGALGVGMMPSRAGERRFAHAAPTFGDDGRVTGAVIVTRDMPTLERDWRGDPEAIYFTDPAGRVIVSNREELLGGPPPQDRVPLHGLDVRRTEVGRYVPREALHLEMPLLTLGVTAEILLDTAPARALALARAQAAGAAMLMLGGLLLVLWDRRRRLALANVTLEARVAARTAALTEEVRERRDAEAALKKAQADLVQAGKLSALGQLSAGISHELNQPLMAIRSFARNAATFLERADPKAVARNIGRIDDLAVRMSRIVQGLSAFARAEPQPAVATDLAEVVAAALEITEARRSEAGIETRVSLPQGPVHALAGEVRMTQVLVNLIGNAVDAMEGGARRVLRIAVTDGPPTLEVSDSGPGLADAEKVFDPFYTTKEVGAGLGMGLSLSYGIVAGFGGTIRGVNAAEGAGGAVFTVVLPAATEAQIGDAA